MADQGGTQRATWRVVFGIVATLAAAAALAQSPDPVVEAERAFANTAAEVGWVRAFREYAAPDGLIAGASLRNALEALAAVPDKGERNLFWWPDHAGIAKSGDLGFTTGPFSVDEARTPAGHYFTVWLRRDDHTWKWIYDGGLGPAAGLALPPHESATVEMLPVAEAGVGSAEQAEREVAELEEQLVDSPDFVRHLAPHARVYRRDRPVMTGLAVAREIGDLEMAPSWTLKRIQGSAAGDLVFTLGEVTWSDGGESRQGFFARVWQYGDEGWRIVYDQIVPRRAAAP